MAPRSSIVRSDRIEYSFYLVFGVDGSMRFARTSPGIDRNERSMSLIAVLPRSLFRVPSLSAHIAVNDPNDGKIAIQIAAGAEAFRTAVGLDLDIDLTINQPKGD